MMVRTQLMEERSSQLHCCSARQPDSAQPCSGKKRRRGKSYYYFI